MNRLPRLVALTLALALALAAPVAQALDVEGAYAAIPHRRTAFDAPASNTPAPQKASLARLFALTDRGVVLRVESMQAHGKRDAAGIKRAVAGYDALVADLGRESFSPEVAPARALIVEALQLQQRHLQSRPEGGLAFNVRRDLEATPDVKQASLKLLKAWGILKRTFPGEPEKNKAAFFDHLCALDFL